MSLTLSKLQTCLSKQPLTTQKKLKELELCIKMQSISVFLDIRKVVDFRWKSADVSRTQEVCCLIYMFF